MDSRSLSDPILPRARNCKYFFHRQWLHLILLLLLLFAGWGWAAPVMGDGVWLGVSDQGWFAWAVALAVLQQVLVWVVWRGQLGWGILTRHFGRADLILWGFAFMSLLIARPLLVFGLAAADQGSLRLSPVITTPLGLVLLLPALYTLWSVGRYFGIVRALGADHFRPEIRALPMVRLGAFRWSRNAMYTFAFLGLWSIALLMRSRAALSLAFFEHAYVWVHYYCTELPDLGLIYETTSGG